MAKRGRPKKNKNVVELWIVEQYYHGDDSTQSWGKPIKVCHSENEAKTTWELEANSYIESLDNPDVDRELSRMITVRPNKEHFYPSMDFWYYHCILANEDED